MRWRASAYMSIQRRRARRSGRSTSSTRTCSRSATGTSSCSTSFTGRRARTSSSASCCSGPGSSTIRRWSRRAREIYSRRRGSSSAGGRWGSRSCRAWSCCCRSRRRSRGRSISLLVTRDVWSLRFNTVFEYQANALTLFADVAVGEQPVRLAQVPVARLQLRPGELLLRPHLPGSQHPWHAPDAVRAGALLQLARDR